MQRRFRAALPKPTLIAGRAAWNRRYVPETQGPIAMAAGDDASGPEVMADLSVTVVDVGPAGRQILAGEEGQRRQRSGDSGQLG